MSGIIIREASTEDIPEMAEIALQCFSEPWSELSFREAIAHGNIVLAAVSGERSVGFLTGSYVLDWSDIYTIAVLERYRFQGVATALLEEFFRILPDDVEIAALEVRVSNSGAIGLYRKMGFREVGRRRDFYRKPREDAILMSKFLKGNDTRK